MKSFYRISASAGTLEIYSDIGFDGVQAADCIAQIDKITAPKITVEINSLGGDVFAALAIYNALRASGKEITTRVMGVAASAAALVFLAGSKRVMPDNTMLMVHGAASGTPGRGTAGDHKDAAALLDQIDNSLLDIFVARTGQSKAAMKNLLAEDTWMTADEARTKGFATAVGTAIEARAPVAMSGKTLPPHVKAALTARAGSRISTATLWAAHHQNQGTK
jgi:ATP-dependent protease ClpP protease subunit